MYLLIIITQEVKNNSTYQKNTVKHGTRSLQYNALLTEIISSIIQYQTLKLLSKTVPKIPKIAYKVICPDLFTKKVNNSLKKV